MMKGRIKLSFLFGLLAFSIIPLSSFALVEDVNLLNYRKDSLDLKERSRQNYIDELNKQILRGEINTKKSYQVLSNRSRSTSSEQSFYIVGGDKKTTLFFYDVSQGFYTPQYGYTFTVSNDISSETDVNFAVYKLNADGTLGSKFIGWENDVHAGESKTVVREETMGTMQNFAIVIENDGYFFQDDIVVSGIASAKTGLSY